MSCDFTKLEYLEETKRLFREKIDPQGEKITDETPFREYVELIGGGDTAALDALLEGDITEIKSNATKIRYAAVDGCENLASVDCPLVTTIDKLAFRDCTNLKTANFPSAISMDLYAFKGCTNLTNINFPALTTMTGYETFVNCTNLKTVKLPSLVTMRSYAFKGCTNLTTVVLKHQCEYIDDCETSLAYAFFLTPIYDNLVNNTGVGYVYVPAALVDWYKDNFNAAITEGGTPPIRALEDYTIDGTIDGELDETKI